MAAGRLYLIPTPLAAGDPAQVLPPATLAALRGLDHFVAERAKTARAVLKAAAHPLPLPQIQISELNEHTPPTELPGLLQPLLDGRNVGLMSEAGCPGVADPGAALVALAHDHSVPVLPLVGPSALLLALMASGMNGQQFCFAGYLPTKPPEREAAIRSLEKTARQRHVTQLFIETPYRNEAMLDSLLKVLQPDTRLAVAVDLTGESESVISRRVAAWRKAVVPGLKDRPAVFLIGV